jgi:hypothetical protein
VWHRFPRAESIQSSEEWIVPKTYGVEDDRTRSIPASGPIDLSGDERFDVMIELRSGLLLKLPKVVRDLQVQPIARINPEIPA